VEDRTAKRLCLTPNHMLEGVRVVALNEATRGAMLPAFGSCESVNSSLTGRRQAVRHPAGHQQHLRLGKHLSHLVLVAALGEMKEQGNVR
jgi:hypothetical protein